MSTDPLHLVCAIIAYSRRNINIAKPWTWELKALTGASEKDFQGTLLALDAKYRREFPSEAQSPPKPEQTETAGKSHQRSASSHLAAFSTECSLKKPVSTHKAPKISLNVKSASKQALAV